MTDIHSHDPLLRLGQNKVFSIQLHPDSDLDRILDSVPPEIFVSAGVHPWHAAEWNESNLNRLESLVHHLRVEFIGEIGLDNVCRIPSEIQIHIFELQLHLAHKLNKSVLIHSVGYHSEVLSQKMKFNNIPTWILHGFRGKSQLVEQYLRSGFFISFGPKYQIDSLRACPLNRLFIETDESGVDLVSLYNKVAQDKGISVSMLEEALTMNFERIRNMQA